MIKIKRILFILLFAMLLYSRFVNLSWGLPYPMHPDERNMANAIQQLQCPIQNSEFRIQNCFNPHFFAYGQFPLYIGYGIVMILKLFDGDLGTAIGFEEAAFSLRIMSAAASILNVLILMKVAELLISKQISNIKYQISIFLVFILSPFFIQFSHFGTTESLLMFLYSVIIYLSIKYSQNKLDPLIFYLQTSIFVGIAFATKVSSVVFLIVPLALILNQIRSSFLQRSLAIWYLLALTLIFGILFSPHNFISFLEFLGSMGYESDVATGAYRAFYTRQFEFAEPIIFQLTKIFPYTLGWPVYIFFLLGFVFLPNRIEFNLLRLAVLSGFLPNAFFYAKWTRFISPIFPLMLVVAIAYLNVILDLLQDLFLKFRFRNPFDKLRILSLPKDKFGMTKIIISFAFCLLSFIFILPGLAYLSIYKNPDVRFTASDWIYKNIPSGSYILSETANVIDPPISTPTFKNPDKHYEYISFNFYDLDENPKFQSELPQHLKKADYIFIPSRRIFANHYCSDSLSFRGSETTEKSSPDFIRTYDNAPLDFSLIARNDAEKKRCVYLRKKYPLLNEYYDNLFSGELGFEKIAEFNSYPKIQFFGKTIIEIPDEEAEETWTVFDHPVFRIYKRI